jgi:hypothetical protein
VFPLLWPLFRTLFKNLNRNICQFFSQMILYPQCPRNVFLSAHSRVLETARSQLEPSKESTVDDPWQRCLFRLKATTLWSKECATMLLWWISERSLHNSPSMHLTASISLFSTSMWNVWLTGIPLGTNSKWMIPLMLKKQINIVFVVDFDIRIFFGLGICHKLFLISLTFYLAISAV